MVGIVGSEYMYARWSMALFASNTIITNYIFDGYGCYMLRIVQNIVTVVLLLQFYYTSHKDPGIIPKLRINTDIRNTEENKRFEDLGKYELNADLMPIAPLCQTCHVYKPPSTSHCLSCDHCVCFFDHHCSWLGNDIGARNYLDFLITLLLVLIFCLVNTSYIYVNYNLTSNLQLRKFFFAKLLALLFYGVFSIYGVIRSTYLLYQHYKQMKNDITTKEVIMNRLTAGVQLKALYQLNTDKLFNDIMQKDPLIHGLFLKYKNRNKKFNGFSRSLIGRKMPILRNMDAEQAETAAWRWTLLLSGIYKE